MNKLLNQYNNTYHHSINKKPINTNYSASMETSETNSKAPNFRVNDRVRITKYKIFLDGKVTLFTLTIGKWKCLLSILV